MDLGRYFISISFQDGYKNGKLYTLLTTRMKCCYAIFYIEKNYCGIWGSIRRLVLSVKMFLRASSAVQCSLSFMLTIWLCIFNSSFSMRHLLLSWVFITTLEICIDTFVTKIYLTIFWKKNADWIASKVIKKICKSYNLVIARTKCCYAMLYIKKMKK